MQLWKCLSGAIVSMGLLPIAAFAAEPIGAAVVVVNQVTAALEAETRTLQSGNDVHQNELIEVGQDASSELKLNDDTKMALGPGAKLKLDRFVYDAEKSKGDIAVNLVKGAFRFVTGVAAKPSYVVRVPQASITVRGTIFDVFVQDNGVSWLLLHEGAVQICNERGQCRVLDEPGKLVRVNDGTVDPPARWNKLKQKASFDDSFPFVDKRPQESPPVLTRDDIFVDVVVPPKKKKVRDPRPPRDHANDSTGPKTKKKPTQKTEQRKPKRKVARGGDDDSQIMDGMGIAIGIGIGGRIGGGGRRGGGDRGMPTGNRGRH